MLLKITTKCSMGCTHCMEDALPEGVNMSIETFEKTKFFIERVCQNIKIIMLSGGEPTSHPMLMQFLQILKGWHVIILSNGLFLSENKDLTKSILESEAFLQIYNDQRYYPTKVIPVEHPKITFGDSINLMSPFGRAVKNKFKSTRQSPLCFNLRSFARTLKNLPQIILTLRLSKKMCIPSIDVYGNVLAGESRFCHKIGTVESSNEEILENILTMKCNKCGLEDNLQPMLRDFINRRKL